MTADSEDRAVRAVAVALATLGALALGVAGCSKAAPARATAPVATPTPLPSRPAPGRAAAAGYPLRPAEKAAVDAFLRTHTELRPATDADRRPAEDGEDVEDLYGVYHPYFVRGDANDDGILDFVLAFVRRDSDRDSPWFSIVVFLGRPEGRFAPGSFLERDVSLADGDFSIDRDSIVVTPDVADESVRRYRWDPSRKRHVFVRDVPEEPDTPAPSRI
jgi:hypothetical protein